LIDAANARQQAVVLLEHVLLVREQILDLGEAPLADLWADSSPIEQRTLVALARLLPLSATVDVPQLTALSARHRVALDEATLDAALQRLAWRDILRADDGTGGARRYRWQLGLFGYWVARTQAI
jgi:hypothetical protein